MIKKLTFKQKIVSSQILLLLTFILLALPLINRSVQDILISSLEATSVEIIKKVAQSPNQEEMISELSTTKGEIYFGLTLYDEHKKMIFDSNISLLTPEEKNILETTVPVEVEAAFHKGKSYDIRKSKMYHRDVVFVAVAFPYQESRYVLRGAFPYAPLKHFTETFSFGFIAVCFIALCVFSVSTWFIFSRFHRPIGMVIDAIRTYQEGDKEGFHQKLAHEEIREDEEFGNLAETLLSLYDQVQKQLSYLEIEKNEKSAILESLGEGVVAVDAKMQITYVNFVGSKMLSQPRRYLIDQPFPTGTGLSNASLFEKSRELLMACQRHNTILTDSVTLDNGKKTYVDLVAAPKSLGNGAIIVLQDKSSQYKVLELGKDFVANASHELRTPITIIRGFAETLQDMKEIPREMMDDIIEKIVRNCERMDTLVKNLLTLADIENLSISPFQSCDVATVLDNCRDMLLAVYPDAHVEMGQIQEHLLVAGDVSLLELAFLNLMTNAAKYSHPPAKIHIHTEIVNDEAKITIRDEGIGIPETDLEHIFERFYTVNKARSRKLGGAGLGLSLVKTIIDKHHGTIAVSSTLGVGTTFIIMIPLARPKS